MDNAGFDVSRWDHWLLIISFVSVASYGLWLSGQWRIAFSQQRRMRSRQSRTSSRTSIGSPSQFSQGQASRLARQNLPRYAPRTELARQSVRKLHAQQQNRHAP